MRKKRKKQMPANAWMRFAKCIDLPDFAQSIDECVEIWGCRTVQLEGAKGIHTYEKDLVKIRMKDRILVLHGSDFDLAQFSDGGLRITGALQRIEWED